MTLPDDSRAGFYRLFFALAAAYNVAFAAWRLDRAFPFIALGLLGKTLGPIGWVTTVHAGEWPIRTFTLILSNDFVWWLPFGLFLLEGTRAGARLRASAPYLYESLYIGWLPADYDPIAPLAGDITGMAVSTALLFILFRPWVTWVGFLDRRRVA